MWNGCGSILTAIARIPTLDGGGGFGSFFVNLQKRGVADFADLDAWRLANTIEVCVVAERDPHAKFRQDRIQRRIVSDCKAGQPRWFPAKGVQGWRDQRC